MKDLLNSIETAIRNQVIESGNFEKGMNYFEEYELESEGNIYFADFYIDAKACSEGEASTFEIDVIYISINLENGNQVLFSKNELYQTLSDILNPRL